MSYGSTGFTNQGKDRETSRLLEESVSLSHHSEDISLRVGERMRSQRENLEGSKATLGRMTALSETATNAIRDLEWNNKRKRVYLWGAISVLFVLNILVLYAMWRNGGKIFASTANHT
jgi:hypothetical protein